MKLGSEITGKQLRAARGALNWSVQHLAEVSGVAVSTIKRYELLDSTPPSRKGHLDTLQGVLEAAGIEFTGVGAMRRGISF